MDDLISRQAVQNYIAHFLSLYLQDNVREAVEAIDEVIGDMPSVDIPPEHDGCKDCVYQANPQDAMPCRECKQNYMDKWKARPSAKPREVLYSGDGYADGEMVYDMAECPNCGREFEDGDETWNCNFCPDCGQALDWGLDNAEED